jgi:glycosyltransferase involved in cell wall biosynthesis
MKILRVINSMNPTHGGPCQGIRNAIPQFLEMGHNTDVVCLDDPNSEFLNKDDFKIIALGPAITPWQYAAALKAWLIGNLKRYEVVIVHGLWQYHAYAVYKAIQHLKNKNIKTPKWYVMPHGMLDPYFQLASDRKLKALRNKVFWNLFDSHVVNHTDAVIFTCEEELLLARKTFKNYQPKAEINVGYGVQNPEEQLKNTNSDWHNAYPELIGKKYFLFLSRIHSKKGVDLLLKGYEHAFSNSNEDYQLVIAGPGMETDYGHQLKTIVNQSDFLNSKVHFTGMLQGDMKWGAFKNCEAFVLPSHQENFGIAVVESLACAKPVLISNKVNIWREIANDNAGIVSNDDINGVILLFKQWQELNEEQKQVLSENAEMCFKSRFTIEQASRQMAEKLKF